MCVSEKTRQLQKQSRAASQMTAATERTRAKQKQDEIISLVQSDLKLTMDGVNLP